MLPEKLKDIPAATGVYLLKSAEGEVLYVGKAQNLRSRVRSYFQSPAASTPPKVEALAAKTEDIEWVLTDNEVEALALESNFIKRHRPHYNIRLRDDKQYPYLCITLSDDYPRMVLKRRYNPRDRNRYFGPFTSSKGMRETMKVVRRLFRVRTCGKSFRVDPRQSPCLAYHIEQCSAPCSARIAKEEYRAQAEQACRYLAGGQRAIARLLRRKMQDQSRGLEYEAAAATRNKLEQVQKTVDSQKVVTRDQTSRDLVAVAAKGGAACGQVFSVRGGKLVGEHEFLLEGALGESPEQILAEFASQYYRDAVEVPKEVVFEEEPPNASLLSEWLTQRRRSEVRVAVPSRGALKKLLGLAKANAQDCVDKFVARSLEDKEKRLESLKELSEALEVPWLPLRIEAFDVSNISGTDSVASMVVFEEGLPKRSEYRRFKIRAPEGKPDDPAMMREAVKRRMTRLKEGRGKFKELPSLLVVDGGRPQVRAALAAMQEVGVKVPTVGLAKEHEELYRYDKPGVLRLPSSSAAQLLLQRIRDEAHRFAHAYHTALRSRRGARSMLEDVPGIGPTRRKALIRHFGSMAKLREASVEEIGKAPKMTRAAAEAVYSYLRGKDT